MNREELNEKDIQLMGTAEQRFADIIWRLEPVPSGKLVETALRELGWKKSTTYTVLRRLQEKGVFQNENGEVTSLISQEAYKQMESREYIKESFGGSLPAFLTAFTSGSALTDEEAEELQKIIDRIRERSRKEK